MLICISGPIKWRQPHWACPHHKPIPKSACTYWKHLSGNSKLHQLQSSNPALACFPYPRNQGLWAAYGSPLLPHQACHLYTASSSTPWKSPASDPSARVCHCLLGTALLHLWIIFPRIKDIRLITELFWFWHWPFWWCLGPKDSCWRFQGWLPHAGEGVSLVSLFWIQFCSVSILSSLGLCVLILMPGKLGCERLQIFTVRLRGLRNCV